MLGSHPLITVGEGAEKGLRWTGASSFYAEAPQRILVDPPDLR